MPLDPQLLEILACPNCRGNVEYVEADQKIYADAHARFLKERPAGAMKSFALAEVPSMFADAYAEAMAWRKQVGISAAEVQRVGMEKFK